MFFFLYYKLIGPNKIYIMSLNQLAGKKKLNVQHKVCCDFRDSNKNDVKKERNLEFEYGLFETMLFNYCNKLELLNASLFYFMTLHVNKSMSDNVPDYSISPYMIMIDI